MLFGLHHRLHCRPQTNPRQIRTSWISPVRIDSLHQIPFAEPAREQEKDIARFREQGIAEDFTRPYLPKGPQRYVASDDTGIVSRRRD